MNILPLAITAGVVGAVLDYPIAKKYPLQADVSMASRLAISGLFVAASVLVAGAIRKGQRKAVAQKHLDEMADLIRQTRFSLAQQDCRTALSNAGKAAVMAGHVEAFLPSADTEFKGKFSFQNEDRMASRDELAMKCFR